jgi:hypothetical protein
MNPTMKLIYELVADGLVPLNKSTEIELANRQLTVDGKSITGSTLQKYLDIASKEMKRSVGAKDKIKFEGTVTKFNKDGSLEFNGNSHVDLQD